MYFKPHLIEKMIRNEKDQTRRICKPGDIAVMRRTLTIANFTVAANEHGSITSVEIAGGEIITRVTNGKRTVYEVGKSVAICPGRGKPTVWFCGTNLIAGDKQYTPASTLAMALGGFKPLRRRIIAIRRERACDISEADAVAEGFAGREAFFEGWDSINGKGKREAEVWALTFENIGAANAMVVDVPEDGTIPPEVAR